MTEYFKYGDNELPARWTEPGKTIPEFWGTDKQWHSVDNPFRWMEGAVTVTKDEYLKLAKAAGVVDP